MKKFLNLILAVCMVVNSLSPSLALAFNTAPSLDNFGFGVLAVNTDKAYYEPGENVFAQLGSLDSKGHTLCNSNLELEVAGPDGKTVKFKTSVPLDFALSKNSRATLGTQDDANVIQNSVTCGDDNVTDNPDYYVNLKAGEEGKYTLVLKNLDTGLQVENNFQVKKDLDFIVARQTATRINPFKSDYKVNLTVTAKKNFDGQVEEFLQTDFNVAPCPTSVIARSAADEAIFTSDKIASDALAMTEPVMTSCPTLDTVRVSQDLSMKRLSFPIKLEAGQTIHLSYQYQAPKISPEFFRLGFLQLRSKTISQALQNIPADITSPVVFSEAKPWQIASDVVSEFKQLSGNWSTVSNWTAGVPSTTNDTARISGTSTVTVDASFTIGTLTILSTSTSASMVINTPNVLTVNNTSTLTSATGADAVFAWSGTGTFSTGNLAMGTAVAPGSGCTPCGNYATSTIATFTVTTNLLFTTSDGSGSRAINPKFILSSGNMSVGGTMATAGFVDSNDIMTLTLAQGSQTGALTLSQNSLAFPSNFTFSPNGTSATLIYSGTNPNINNTTYTNLTISGSATNSNTFTVAGAFSVTGTYAPSGGTVTFNNGASISNTGTLTFATATLASSAAVTTSSSFAFNNAFNLASFSTFTALDGTVTASGTAWRMSNSGNIYFASTTIAATPSLRPSADFYFSGKLTVNSGVTFSPSTNNVTASGTGWSITNLGTLDFYGFVVAGTPSTQPSADFSFQGILSVNSGYTLAPTSGTISASSTSWTISNSGTLTFASTTIAGTPATQPTANFAFNNKLTVNSGVTLAPTSGTVTASGTAWTIVNSGTLTFASTTIAGTPSTQPTADFAFNNTLTINSGVTFAPASGTVTASGSSASIVNSGTLTFNNLTIGNGTNAATTTSNTTATNTVTGILTISPNAVLVAGPGSWLLTSAGTPLVNNGTFTASTSLVSFRGTSATTSVPGLTYYNLDFSPASGNQLYQITVQYPAWTLATTTPNVVRSLVFNSIDGAMYAGHDSGRIISCSTSCATASNWTVAIAGLAQIYSLAFDSTNGIMFAGVGLGRIYRCSSSCNTGNWGIATSTSVIPYSLAFDSINGVMYAGDSGSRILRCATTCTTSTNWIVATTTGDDVNALAFDSTNGVIYAGNASSTILRCSTTCGTSTNWTVATTTTAEVNALAFDSTNGVIYAGNASSTILRCSTTCGTSTNWTVATTTSGSIQSLAFDSINKVMFAGSAGNRIYRCFISCGTSTNWSEATSTGATTYSLGFDPTNAVMYAGDNSSRVLRLSVASSLTATNNLTLNGSGNETVDASTSNIPVTVGGNFTIGSGDTFSAPSATTTISGNFTNNGTFTHNNGTVVFTPSATSTISGVSTSFYNLMMATAGKELKLGTSGAPVFTIAGTLTVTGSSTAPAWITSDSGGSQWLVYFNSTQNSISYASIKDAGCYSGSASVTNNNNTNISNNGTCWFVVSDGGGGGIIYGVGNGPVDNGQGNTTLNGGGTNQGGGVGSGSNPGGAVDGGSGGGSGSGGGTNQGGGGGGASP